MLVADCSFGLAAWLSACDTVLPQLIENCHFGLLTAPDLGLPLYCWGSERSETNNCQQCITLSTLNVTTHGTQPKETLIYMKKQVRTKSIKAIDKRKSVECHKTLSIGDVCLSVLTEDNTVIK